MNPAGPSLTKITVLVPDGASDAQREGHASAVTALLATVGINAVPVGPSQPATFTLPPGVTHREVAERLMAKYLGDVYRVTNAGQPGVNLP